MSAIMHAWRGSTMTSCEKKWKNMLLMMKRCKKGSHRYSRDVRFGRLTGVSWWGAEDCLLVERNVQVRRKKKREEMTTVQYID